MDSDSVVYITYAMVIFICIGHESLNHSNMSITLVNYLMVALRNRQFWLTVMLSNLL